MMMSSIRGTWPVKAYKRMNAQIESRDRGDSRMGSADSCSRKSHVNVAGCDMAENPGTDSAEMHLHEIATVVDEYCGSGPGARLM